MIVALIGVTGCVKPEPESEPAVCRGLERHVAKLSDALAAHPETHNDVGEPATDVVIGFGAGCGPK